jgi:hypothetical protein
MILLSFIIMFSLTGSTSVQVFYCLFIYTCIAVVNCNCQDRMVRIPLTVLSRYNYVPVSWISNVILYVIIWVVVCSVSEGGR